MVDGTIDYIHGMLHTVVVDEDATQSRHQLLADFLLRGNDDLWTNSAGPESGSCCPERFRVDVFEYHHTP